MSSLDSLITSDLAALGDDSRRSPTALDDALQTTNMYRDDRPGAEARRDALADERRRELVMMPLTLSHVFAHRVGRAAAGASAFVCTIVLLTMLPSRTLPSATSTHTSADSFALGSKLYSMSLPVMCRLRISLTTTLIPPCLQ